MSQPLLGPAMTVASLLAGSGRFVQDLDSRAPAGSAATETHHQRPARDSAVPCLRGPRAGPGTSLAIEIACNQIFYKPHHVSGMVGRTWALWTH